MAQPRPFWAGLTLLEQDFRGVAFITLSATFPAKGSTEYKEMMFLQKAMTLTGMFGII